MENLPKDSAELTAQLNLSESSQAEALKKALADCLGACAVYYGTEITKQQAAIYLSLLVEQKRGAEWVRTAFRKAMRKSSFLPKVSELEEAMSGEETPNTRARKIDCKLCGGTGWQNVDAKGARTPANGFPKAYSTTERCEANHAA